jgi:hypothetical protein
MYNPIKPKPAVHPSINALALLGPRAMEVIDRHRSITAIAVYEPTLGPKVVRFREVRDELSSLVLSSKKLTARANARIGELDALNRVWGANLQHGISADSEDVGITDARALDGAFDRALNVMTKLREHDELPFAAQALSELESQYGVAKAADDAARAARVAVQAKQRELQAVAADVQKELVKLRTVVRIALGVSHLDYQCLLLRSARAEVEAQDESPPDSADGSPAGDRASEPSETG